MKLLVTGASGFIGSNFRKIYKEKYDITTFSFLHDSIDALDLHGIDAVLHLSALVHQMGGAPSEQYYEVNVNNTVRLAEKCKETGSALERGSSIPSWPRG